ncbi:MAG: creatininase family protein [Akkermansiaceae bacterium]|nr:creatininase family protein [Akkermansiaceae bacterium]
MRTLSKVRWSDLRPDDFLERQRACPIVYMPIGLCEPHGHVAALGLDTLKADYYCEEAAERFGGIVAPTQGYHIHECGFHKPWLDEVVGDSNPLLAGMPPQVVCYHFLYQLRAFANAGFHAVIVVSGHAGGSQIDLRRVAKAFTNSTGIPVVVKTDPEWGGYEGDHAGAYEISQLQAIHPEAVDLSLLERMNDEGSGGRLALGLDAAEASPEKGKEINETIIAAIGAVAEDIRGGTPIKEPIDYQLIEEIWSGVLAQGEWWSMGLK